MRLMPNKNKSRARNPRLRVADGSRLCVTPARLLLADGFTLIEVLISIVILTFISLGIYQSTTETFHLREILSNEGDFYNSIRLSMNIMQRDISMIYTPTLMIPNPAPSPSSSQAPQVAGRPAPTQPVAQPSSAFLQSDPDLAVESDFWVAAVDKTGIRPSRFIGSEKKISFIGASHYRMYKDTAESEFSKITYELVEDEFDKESMMLIKTESTDVFQMEERKDISKRTYALLHGIKKLKFRFYRKDKNLGEWQPTWDSDTDEVRNMFPDIVEVNFEVTGPSKLFFNGIYDFRPEIPLNGLNPSS
jgi:prepilin-type N-terminal cleavage/methylation domain-containing protein